MEITVSQRVTIADKQLHGNQSILVDGQVLAIEGSSAKVQIDGEDFPRDFSLSQIKSSEETYGAERTSHFDNQVINAIRR
jgi:hypothetical protein